MVQFRLDKSLREIFFPILKTVGDLWHRGEMSITGEHMITQAVRRYLIDTLQKKNGAGGPTAIVACAPDEFMKLEPWRLQCIYRTLDAGCVHGA